MLHRRTLLVSSTVLGLTAALPRAGSAQQASEQSNARDAALDRMLQSWFDADLRDHPTLATNLGLDIGANADLRGRLGDASIADIARDKARATERDRELQTFSPEGLSSNGLLNYDIAAFRWSVSAEAARFHYGARGRVAPYTLTQLSGSYYGVPDFLNTQHPIQAVQDAEYYLSRLEDYARNLGREVERVSEDASNGVVPPDFILDRTIANLEHLRATPAAESTIVRSLARRTAAAGIAGDWTARAIPLVSGPISQALDRQIAVLRELRPDATHDAGCWRLPEGEAYYRLGIRSNTTTAMSGEEVHRAGLDQVAELNAQLDRLMRERGWTRGTVGERLNRTNTESRFLFPNTEDGRTAMLAALNRQVRDIQPLLSRVFNRAPRAAVEIRRIPVEIESGAPGAIIRRRVSMARVPAPITSTCGIPLSARTSAFPP